MGLNFIPSRERLSKEIELCVQRGSRETLLSFCNSCVMRTLGPLFSRDCENCNVKRGIQALNARDRFDRSVVTAPTTIAS